MADSKIQVIKLKVRRGTDAQRLTIKLDQGELGFTTDTKRFFVGDGVTMGGINVGTKVFPTISNTYTDLTGVNAQVGDIASVDGVAYQLIGTDYKNINNWLRFSPDVDDTYIEYSNNTTGFLTIRPQSIDAAVLEVTSLSSNSINFNSGKVNVNFNTTLFNDTSGSLSVSDGGLSARHISTQTIGAGLSGGAGVPIFVDIDNDTIQLIGNKLTVANSPVTALRLEDLGLGFDTSLWSTDRTLRTVIASVCATTFTIGASGTLSLQSPPLTTIDAVEMPYVTVDRGYIAGISSAIYDILSANDAVNLAYNGAPNQLTKLYVPSSGQTAISALSSSGTIVLSSAGFIVFEGGRPTRNNASHTPDRFAIPVFTLPN